MDTACWPQNQKIGLVKPMKETPSSSSSTRNNASNNCSATVSRPQMTERRPVRPQKDQRALNCPRCNSTNTKFCYYNNYSFTQPRYFCKACKRYWTEGGSLRNVPVGGGTRKNKRSSLISSSSARFNTTDINSATAAASASTAKKPTSFIPPKFYDQVQDLNQLAFQHNGLPGINYFTVNNNAIDMSNACPPVGASSVDLLRNEIISTSGSFGPFITMPVVDYASALGLKELRPVPTTVSFPFDGARRNQAAAWNEKNLYGSIQGREESDDGRSTLFPFDQPEPVVHSSATADYFVQGISGGGGDPPGPGFWINGISSEGGSW